MEPTTKIVRKIRWYIWEEPTLTIQVVTKRMIEEGGELVEATPIGSVKYTFNDIDSKEKVESIIKDIVDGKIK
jgi:hypothetical protein